MRERRMGQGAFLGEEAVLADSGRAGEKGDFFSILLRPLSIPPRLTVHVCPYFMHPALFETIPCSLVPQILQVFYVSIFQSLWARFESEQLVDGLSLL
mgnify:CR=1 FL=1